MGFRFRKSLRIAPGIRVNLSTRGVSTSVGPKGATLNVSKRGLRATAQTGIPGLSYSTKLGGGSRGGPSPRPRLSGYMIFRLAMGVAGGLMTAHFLGVF
jgi:hypothetical protein